MDAQKYCISVHTYVSRHLIQRPLIPHRTTVVSFDPHSWNVWLRVWLITN